MCKRMYQVDVQFLLAVFGRRGIEDCKPILALFL